MFKSKKCYIIKINENRIETQRVIKSSENNLTTRFGNYLIEPTHGLPNVNDGTLWYFVNENTVKCFNPSTLEKDFEKIFKTCENYTKFYKDLIEIIRNMQYDTKISEHYKTYLESLTKIIYEFVPDKKTDSDNIRVVPSTQKNIMENEVAKQLSARSKPHKWMVLLYMGFGLLPGVLLGIWLGGDVYNQQDYNENYYSPDLDNGTTVITAGFGLSGNVGYSFNIPSFDTVLSTDLRLLI